LESFDVAIVGAGILGLAHALAAADRGLRVIILDRTLRPLGASVRNFGMIWVIGQTPGAGLDLALRSRRTWLDLAKVAPFWVQECGALHVAVRPEELAVMEEFVARHGSSGYDASLLTPDEAVRLSPGLRRDRILGAMRTTRELAVDPREAILAVESLLARRSNIRIARGVHVRRVSTGEVELADERCFKADRIIVCSGPDLRSLLPGIVGEGVACCKLQMVRTIPQPAGWRLGTHVAAGLSLVHYKSFAECPSLAALRRTLESEHPEHLRLGVNVLVSQNQAGELTIGDSHEYAPDVDHVDRAHIDELVLGTLAEYFQAPTLQIAERWHGVYPKRLDGAVGSMVRAASGVYAAKGFAGNGMTVSFAFAADAMEAIMADREIPSSD